MCSVDSDAALWIRFWAFAAVTVVSLAAIIAWYNHSITKAAFENGYIEEQMPGTTSTRWVKEK